MRSSIVLSLAATIIAAPVFAHEGDVGIRINAGKLETVLASGEPPTQTFGTEIERVFAVELAWNPVTSEVIIDEPGFASDAAGLLNQTLGFNFRAALRKWNGSGFDATAQTMSAGGGDLGLPFLATPASDVLTPGHAIVVPQIPLDFHFDWRLDGATETTGMGVYLVEVELTNPGGSLMTSDPIWFVFNWNEDELVHEEAIEYVVTNLVPAPGAALAFGIVALVGRRRRR
jgi:hypothetical protein